VKEAPLAKGISLEAASFLSSVATVLELPIEALQLSAEEDPAGGWTFSRWLGGLGLGLVRVAQPESFSWAGPWIARLADRRSVVMYGVPSGIVWDPAGGAESEVVEGFVIAAADVVQALPPKLAAPTTVGTVEEIAVAAAAGEQPCGRETVRALAGLGLEGDRHVSGRGTFPSRVTGSALTLIEAEVCESFDPPLLTGEHRRNIVTRGIDLNALIGVEFAVGGVRCRGVRLCEPCRVMDGYAARPLLRALVHRGGLRADILDDGEIRLGDPIVALG